jgi:hypothetical protein
MTKLRYVAEYSASIDLKRHMLCCCLPNCPRMARGMLLPVSKQRKNQFNKKNLTMASRIHLKHRAKSPKRRYLGMGAFLSCEQFMHLSVAR